MRIYLVRHADAGSRSKWDQPDHLRPLSTKGRGRAEQLSQLLADLGVDSILSSPYVRCVETVQPLARATGLPVQRHAALTEGAWPAEGLALLEELVSQRSDAVLCSHGDVIPALLEALARRGAWIDPTGRCPKGSIWVLSGEDGALQRATYAGTGDLVPG